jgi:hypothetical protein
MADIIYDSDADDLGAEYARLNREYRKLSAAEDVGVGAYAASQTLSKDIPEDRSPSMSEQHEISMALRDGLPQEKIVERIYQGRLNSRTIKDESAIYSGLRSIAGVADRATSLLGGSVESGVKGRDLAVTRADILTRADDPESDRDQLWFIEEKKLRETEARQAAAVDAINNPWDTGDGSFGLPNLRD